MSWIKNRSFVIVFRIQSVAVFIVTIILWFLLDLHSAISAMLGGSVSIISTIVFAVIVSLSKGYTANDTVRIALRAEAVKITLIVSLLWIVLKFYESVNVVVFIGTFILSVLIYSMALLVVDNTTR